ncbi:TPA: hypothetical protein KOY96_002957 [Clostridioides difficile]|nr:hypothetical protein [Clostridioides difficile]EJA6616299.1 hypothetical protein [Clostridioides difficile]MBU5298391.1 hypothetical protein [Clostridioides difficile]MBY2041834.1 hypothetical protein [Clostridioides difficile]MCI2341681.1 hypothetical protein [Clostridioides difficile]MCW0569348.1 hypothetical protein [Clostridioides difficile]
MRDNLLNNPYSEEKEYLTSYLKTLRQKDEHDFYVFKRIVDIYCKQAKYK